MSRRPATLRTLGMLAASLALVQLAPPRSAAEEWKHARMSWGAPDLQGTWTNATITGLERSDEIEKLTSVVQAVRARLDGYMPLFPKRVLLVKTTGKEEGNATYTRGNAMILPQRVLSRNEDQLERVHVQRSVTCKRRKVFLL